MKEKIFAGVVLLAACASALAAEPTKTVNVNCGAGLTIAQAASRPTVPSRSSPDERALRGGVAHRHRGLLA